MGLETVGVGRFAGEKEVHGKCEEGGCVLHGCKRRRRQGGGSGLSDTSVGGWP